ncbi:MAG: hypothetical protein Q8M26_18475 [Pseudolabrys sp.]|nr:hypothetical protein [Pseudolabrys sp.]
MGIWTKAKEADATYSLFSWVPHSLQYLFPIGWAAVVGTFASYREWIWTEYGMFGICVIALVSALVASAAFALVAFAISKLRGSKSTHSGESGNLPIEPALPVPSLQKGLYVADVRIGLKTLEKDRHTEITLRVFNGTGRVVEFSSLSGFISFYPSNRKDDHLRRGVLPTPTVRSDVRRAVEPFEEWFLILAQRVPSDEADKLTSMLDANDTIIFELERLKIEAFAHSDDRKIEPIPMWYSMSYKKEFGFQKAVVIAIPAMKIGG